MVPDTDLEGVNADRIFDVTAADVVGELGLDAAGNSLTDFYSFSGQAGSLVNLQVMSRVLGRPQGSFDTTMTVYDSSGQVVAFDDDSFQDQDSTIIDLTLPETETYYVEITPYSDAGQSTQQSGAYELFLYTFAAAGDPPAGDTMYAGSGQDTIIAGTGDDTIVAQPPRDTVLAGSGTPTFVTKAPYLRASAGPNQTVNEGDSVTLTSSFVDPSDGDSHFYDWHVVASSGQIIADGTGPVFTFSPGNAGVYTAALSISDQNGGSASAVTTVTSNAVTPILSAPAHSQSAAAGQNVTINLGSLAVKGVGPWTVSVNWGDGLSSTFSPPGSGSLALAHSYASVGNHSISETVSEHDGGAASTSFVINVVAVAQPVNVSAVPVAAHVGVTTGTIVFATFTDPGGGDPIADYGASIAWGDGQTSTGAITFDSITGVFSVSGAHTYAQAGTSTVTVTVSHENALLAKSTASAAISQATSTTLVNASTASTVYGQPVTLTATVSGFGIPSGSLTFYDGPATPANLLGTAPLHVVNGQDIAVYSTVVLSVSGSPHVITALYSGDTNNRGSAATVSHLTVVDATSITIGVSTATSPFGQSMTLKATVAANAPGSGTPTGTVDFFDMTTGDDLGTATLTSGAGSLKTAILTPGLHVVKVSYSGDSNFLASNAIASTITINQSVIVLDATAAGAVNLSGNASITVSGGVFVDSSAATAITAGGNAQLSASVIDIVGGYTSSGNAKFTPTPVTKAVPLPDPLASLAAPSVAGLSNLGSVSLAGNSKATIVPGIYGQISASGNAVLNMSAGVYIIKGGGFQVSGNAIVNGAGVTLYNGSTTFPAAGGTFGGISLSGNGMITLSAPATGPDAGVLIIQPSANKQAVSLSGNAIAGASGILYAPSAQLAESGNAQLKMALIVDTLVLSGSALLNSLGGAAAVKPGGALPFTEPGTTPSVAMATASHAVQPPATPTILETASTSLLPQQLVGALATTAVTGQPSSIQTEFLVPLVLPAQSLARDQIAPQSITASWNISYGHTQGENLIDERPDVVAGAPIARMVFSQDQVQFPGTEVAADFPGAISSVETNEISHNAGIIPVARGPAGPLAWAGRFAATDRGTRSRSVNLLMTGGFCGPGARLLATTDPRVTRTGSTARFFKSRNSNRMNKASNQ